MTLSKRTALSFVCAIGLPILLTPSLWATLYTIPGTSIQIDIRNTSTDPQYQLTAADITQILTALARFPSSQLQALRYVQAQPYGSNPLSPGAVTGSSADGGIIFYLQGATPYDFNGVIPEDMSFFAYTQLTSQQMQEWAVIPGHQPFPFSIGDFTSSYTFWAYNSDSLLSSALRIGDPGSILSTLYMAAVFTNWVTDQLFFYTSSTSAPQLLSVTLDQTHWAFGAYQFFLQNGAIVAYQIGSGPKITLATSLALTSIITNHIPISQQFTRPGTSVNIQILQSGDPSGQFTPTENTQLLSLLNILPADHLKGISLIQAIASSNKPSNSSSQNWAVNGSAITLYVGTNIASAFDSNVLQSIGFSLYGNALTSAQKTEYASYLPAIRGGLQANPNYIQNSFTADYSDWILNPPLTLALNALLPPTKTLPRRPRKPPVLNLGKALFMASLFVDAASQTISFYIPGPNQTYTLNKQPVTWTANILTLGSYQYQTNGNTITAERSLGGAWISLPSPAPIPQALLAKLPAAPAPSASAIQQPAIQVAMPTENSLNVDPVTTLSPVASSSAGNPFEYISPFTQEGQARIRKKLLIDGSTKAGYSYQDVVEDTLQSSPHPVGVGN